MNGSTAAHTRESLRHGIVQLGVCPGDVLFIHSSFRSLGRVDGGAGTVVAALEDAIGHAGTILMPSFHLVENEKRAETWNVSSTPATTGWLTEFFRTMPGTVRSDHYSHAVAARGARADWFVSGHLEQDGMRSPWDRPPWGATYGTHSPMVRAYDADGKILMLGVDYHSSTYMHLVEVRHWNDTLRGNPQAEYFWINRPVLGEHWDSLGWLRRGRVGASDARLFPIRDFVDTLLDAVKREPARFFKYWKAAPPEPPGKPRMNADARG